MMWFLVFALISVLLWFSYVNYEVQKLNKKYDLGEQIMTDQNELTERLKEIVDDLLEYRERYMTDDQREKYVSVLNTIKEFNNLVFISYSVPNLTNDQLKEVYNKSVVLYNSAIELELEFYNSLKD